MGESAKDIVRFYSFMVMFGLIFLIFGAYSIITDLHSGHDPDPEDIGFAFLGSSIIIYDVWNFGYKSFLNHIIHGGIIIGIGFSFVGLIHLNTGADKWGTIIEPREAGFTILIGVLFTLIFGMLYQLLKRYKKHSNQGMDPTR